MLQLFFGSIVLSFLHGLIPNHWLPVLAIGRKENWSAREVNWITFLCALAHACSTLLIGILIGLAGWKLSLNFSPGVTIIAPSVLVLLGLYFIYQHHRHHHFHIRQQPDPSLPKSKIVALLVTTMFFSPCLEIEAYFFMAGTRGVEIVFLVGLIYLVLSIGGIMLWVRWAFKKSMSMNWHALEHNAGIITGGTLVATGILTYFIH